MEKKWFFETCKKRKFIVTKFSHNKPTTHTEKELLSRINNSLTDKVDTHLNPFSEQVNNLVKGAIHDYTQHFRRLKNKCVFFVKINHARHDTAKYFMITNRFRNQNEEGDEANKLGRQIDRFEQEESGYIFASIKKTIKMFR